MTLIATTRHCHPSYSCPMQQAYWNGTQVVFGEGRVVDDIVGYELTHAVTRNTSKLKYEWQSGAISESLSDVWGEFIDLDNKRVNDTKTVRWQIGEDLVTGAYRDMEEPGAIGTPVYPEGWFKVIIFLI